MLAKNQHNNGFDLHHFIASFTGASSFIAAMKRWFPI
jgi:hypothetical protein